MEKKELTEKERYYSVIDCNGNFELRDYECGKTIHSLFELDDLLNRQDARIKELEDMVVKKQNKLYSRLDEIMNLQEEKQQLKIENGSLNEIVLILIEQLKQSQNQKAIEELEALTRELNLDFEQAKERLQALQDYYTKSIEMLDDERKRILSKVDSDESFSLQTYRSLYRMFNENILKIELFSQFVHDLHMLEVEL